MTDLNVADDGFPFLLKHRQAFLHPRVQLDILAFPIHQLHGIVKACEWGIGKEFTVIALTRLFADCVALAIWVRIFGFS